MLKALQWKQSIVFCVLLTTFVAVNNERKPSGKIPIIFSAPPPPPIVAKFEVS